MQIDQEQLRYLQLLAKSYPTIQAASTEIINLNAQMQLPKGTEHFLSDIHGEYEAFLHVLRNSSGSIKRKIDENFTNSLTDREKLNFATLIYYPEKKLPLILQTVDDEQEWYRITLFRLIKLCRIVSSKYTRAGVRAALPSDFGYVIEELLHEQEGIENKQAYYQSIVETIISIGRAQAFIIAMAKLIQRLAIAHLHIIGDIYDRGPGAHIIMDTLLNYHSVDIQWGNHDIIWMGAAAGSAACIANIIRIALRYANMETLENGYAISLLPLASFAMDVYNNDLCAQFKPKLPDQRAYGDEEYTENELRLMAQMQKAITIMQLKLEAQIIMRRPHFEMQDRLLLDKINFDKQRVKINGKTYPLLDAHFPTIDPANPYELTEREQAVIDRLQISFMHSEKLQQHTRFLFSEGSMYQVYNGNLLYHGCIPMDAKGDFTALPLDGQVYRPRDYMNRVEQFCRQGYFAADPAQKEHGQDVMWYLWSGARSPLFGKSKMATFERYFLAEKETHAEEKNPYYQFRDRVATVRRILTEFGLDPETARIINGHVPVRVKRGESPIKADGQLLVIDGGFSKAYQQQTGIAGYTLIHNSYGFLLAAHEPFQSTQAAIEKEADIHSRTNILDKNFARMRVKDTDAGREFQRRIEELNLLLAAYRTGLIKESPAQR